MRRHDQHTRRLTPTQKRLLAIVASYDVPPTQRQISLRFTRWAIRSPRFPPHRDSHAGGTEAIVAELVALPQRSAPAAPADELNLAAVRSRISVVNDRARKARDSDDTGYALHNYRLALDHSAVLLHTLLERVEQHELAAERAGQTEIREAA